jgi:hypothetical protein
VNAGRTSLDHGLHQFKCVQSATEPGFGIGNQRGKPVNTILTLGVVDLVGPHQSLVNAAAQIGHAVGGIETLVGIHLAGVIGVGGNLPATHVDGLQTSFHLLDRLVAGHCAQRRNIAFALQEGPQALGAHPGQCVFHVDGSAQPLYILNAIGSGDARPAGV